MKRTRDLNKYIQNMIYIYCLHTTRLPNSLVEAMMCGLPVISYPAIMVKRNYIKQG